MFRPRRRSRTWRSRRAGAIGSTTVRVARPAYNPPVARSSSRSLARWWPWARACGRHFWIPMKSPVAALLLAIAAAAQTPAPSPAQKAIAAAQEQIKKDSTQPEGYNELAKALVRRGRETADADYYRQAARAVEGSLRIEPDNFEGLKARVMVMLGLQEYAPALELARKLNKRIPDDVLLYGLITDACMELG